MKFGSITTGIIADGLVFNMDAANRASYPKTGTTSFNTTNLSESGSLENDTVFNTDNSGIWDFDGTDDYINTNFDFTGMTSLSVDAWCNANSVGSFNVVFSQWKNNNFGQSSVVLETVSSEMWFIIANGGGIASAKSSFSTGAWKHVVGTWDGSTVKVYVNGVIGGTTAAQSAMNSSTLPSIMGGLVTTGGGFIDGDWNGKIANTKIYNRALSSTEVLHNYNALKGRFT